MIANATRWVRHTALILTIAACTATLWGQASDIPSAAPGPPSGGSERGRKLLDQMIQALGGDAWLHRKDMVLQGRSASFYKGQPNEGVTMFEEFRRPEPFASRIEIITKLGVFIPTARRDVIQLYTTDGGFEYTYRGRKDMRKEDIVDFQRRRRHSIDSVVSEWLKEPGTEVVYEGTQMIERHLADKISLLTAKNDAVEIELDSSTHLPLSRTFEWRDEIYHDHDVDREDYDDYHPIQGVMTPLTITRFRNGDMVSQRFFTSVTYNQNLSADLFDPNKVTVKKK